MHAPKDAAGQTLRKLAVVLLLMVFVFALANLIFNLENLYLGTENMPEFIPGGADSGAGIASSGTVANAIRWLYYGFLGFLVLTLIVGAVSFGRSKDSKKWRRLLVQMVAALLVCLALVAFGFFYEDIESGITGTGSTDILVGGPTNASFQNTTAAPTPPDTMRTVALVGILAMVAAFWLLSYMGIITVMRMRSSGLDYEDIEQRKAEVARAITRTLDDLAGGSDTRAAVIRCYRDMCGIMARHGVEEKDSLTPREFERLAIESLPVSRESMSDLILVFEEARYSRHELTEADADRARLALEAVREQLETAGREDTEADDDGA